MSNKKPRAVAVDSFRPHKVVQKVASLPGSKTVASDQCQFGLRASDSGTLMRKRTRLMTNSNKVIEAFSGKDCTRDHQHVHVLGQDGHGQSRAARASVYPMLMRKALAKAFLDEAVP